MRLRWRLRAAMLSILFLALFFTVAIQAVRLRQAEAQIQRIRAEAEQARYAAAVAQAQAQFGEARANEVVQRLLSSAVSEGGQQVEDPAGGTTSPAP